MKFNSCIRKQLQFFYANINFPYSQVICDGPQGREDSFGKRRRRKRDANNDDLDEGDDGVKGKITGSMFTVYENREEIREAR